MAYRIKELLNGGKQLSVIITAVMREFNLSVLRAGNEVASVRKDWLRNG